MLRVTWPVTAIATRSGTPARTRFRAAVRRKSCRSFVATITGRPFALSTGAPSASSFGRAKPAFAQADVHALRKSTIGRPRRWNTSSTTRGVPCLSLTTRACQRCSRSATRSPSIASGRPRRFLECSGRSRIMPPSQSTSAQVSVRISPRRQPVR